MTHFFCSQTVHDRKATHMKHILKALVEIPTITKDYQANNQALNYITNFLSERGMHVTRHEFNGFESLVATTKNTKTPTLFLSGHIDVVDADEKLFKLTEDSDNFYGRGVFDMKFGIAAFLHVVDTLKNNLDDYDFGIMITTDEEIGGQNGTKQLLKRGYSSKVCVIPDGGKDWAIEESAKGVTWFTITMPGKSTHSSRPWDGENALEKLIALLAEVKTILPEASPGTSTLVLSQLKAGQATNQVPDTAEARLDGRFLSLKDQENTKQQVTELCNKHGAKLDIPVDDPFYVNDPANPYIAAFIEETKKVIGYAKEPMEAQGASDARFFGQHKIPCVVVYPPGGEYHAPGEHIQIDGFYKFGEILTNYVMRVAKKPR